jgi:peptidoglycan/LPS O-acetylase OafA/YrhL
LIYLTLPLLQERPEGMPRSRDVIAGLTFIQNEWLHTGVLDDSFWSLFVEVKYYFIFGTLYFAFGTKKAIAGLFIFFCIWVVAASVVQFTSTPSAFFIVLKNITKTQGLSFNEFSWFASGSLAYLYYTTKNRSYLLIAALTGIIAASTVALTSSAVSRPAFIVPIFFLAAVGFERVEKLLANKILVFIGFISYPLYLIHQNTMIALIAKMGKQFSFIPGALLPVIPVLLLMLVSYFIAKLLEPTIRKKLNHHLVSPVVKYFQNKEKVATSQVLAPKD